MINCEKVKRMVFDFEKILEQMKYDQLESDLDKIALVQQIFSKHFPFENIDVLLQDKKPITEQYLYDKMFQQQRGGLCYEQNGLLYLVLKKLGFDVILVAGTMWRGDHWAIEGTHAIVLFKKADELYVIDNGSGNQLALQPLLLDGDSVVNQTGKYRVRTEKTEKGTIVTERFTEEGWVLWYTFSLKAIEINQLTKIKDLITHHPDSPFSERLLLAKVIGDGTISINEERFHRKWSDGREQTIPFQSEGDMLRKLKEYGSVAVVHAARKYVNRIK